MIVLAVVVAPVVEEMLFRGLFQTMIRSYLGRPWPAIAITSLLFASIHENPEPLARPVRPGHGPGLQPTRRAARSCGRSSCTPCSTASPSPPPCSKHLRPKSPHRPPSSALCLRGDLRSPLSRPLLGEVQMGEFAEPFHRLAIVRPRRLGFVIEVTQTLISPLEPDPRVELPPLLAVPDALELRGRTRCLRLFRMFCSRVHTRRLNRQLFALFPSMWSTTIPLGGCAIRRCMNTFFFSRISPGTRPHRHAKSTG